MPKTSSASITRREEKNTPPMHDELSRLREENERLKALLTAHGVPWECNPRVSQVHSSKEAPSSSLSTSEKIALFRRLFRGRDDVYPVRWESAKGTSGYAPACANQWKAGICEKPKVKCAKCPHRLLLPMSDQVIYDHLSGKLTAGVYPLLNGDRCWFLALDLDEGDWREDAQAFQRTCLELNIPAALEISRSGNGAHIWIFFSEPVPACDARTLGTLLVSRTCRRTRQLSLNSYDRFFPNQDTLPGGGFGNLIALPLQKSPRAQGRTVFVDESLETFPDQWAFLASLRRLSREELEDVILRTAESAHPLDVAFTLEEDETPWRRTSFLPTKIEGTLPVTLRLVLSDSIYIEKEGTPQSLANRLIRLAAFQNPEFHKAQAMRMPVWNKARIIGCAENFPRYIGLPRGRLDAVLELLEENGVRAELQEERFSGSQIAVGFIGTLRTEQSEAVRALLRHDTGVLCAPPAFGKTVVAAALIAERKRSTLVLVHRTDLLRQWRERLETFLELPEGGAGVIGGGKNTSSGKVDIAVMQTLARIKDLAGMLDHYGQIIVDECHHISAVSFESILKQSKARYVVGLTATPQRRDGHQPIIFMQCGPIRHSVVKPEHAPARLEVRPRLLSAFRTPPELSIQEVFRILMCDEERNRRIAGDVLDAYREGRRVLVLTERTEHLTLLQEALGDEIEHCFLLHGRLSKKQRADTLSGLQSLDGAAPRVLLATGRLIGEGFDHAPLDTLVLAMPISWKGTLCQYAGRLHREHDEKEEVRIYDYVEKNDPRLLRMWNKRRTGYRSMGYAVGLFAEN